MTGDPTANRSHGHSLPAVKPFSDFQWLDLIHACQCAFDRIGTHRTFVMGSRMNIIRESCQRRRTGAKPSSSMSLVGYGAPDQTSYYDGLQAAYQKLRSQFDLEELNLEPHLAIVVKESLKLPRGDMENSLDYRERFDESIELDAFKNDETCKSFSAEVDRTFKSAVARQEN